MATPSNSVRLIREQFEERVSRTPEVAVCRPEDREVKEKPRSVKEDAGLGWWRQVPELKAKTSKRFMHTPVDVIHPVRFVTVSIGSKATSREDGCKSDIFIERSENLGWAPEEKALGKYESRSTGWLEKALDFLVEL